MTLREAALAYAEHGWPVFPCQVKGKKPLVDRGFLEASTDARRVASWWARWTRANPATVPGRCGYVVVDVDGEEGAATARSLGLLNIETLRAKTARGWHLWFRHPGGVIGNQQIGPGLDVRGDRGYVLLPPAIHPSGAVYRWDVRVNAAPAPAIIGAIPEAAPLPSVPESPVNAGTSARQRYVARAVELECTEVARAPEGARNNALNSAAFSLGRFALNGEADPAKLADALTFAARHAGLPGFEISRTIASAFRARGVR